LISKNARITTIEIASQLNSMAITINNRIKNLIKACVLVGF